MTLLISISCSRLESHPPTVKLRWLGVHIIKSLFSAAAPEIKLLLKDKEDPTSNLQGQSTDNDIRPQRINVWSWHLVVCQLLCRDVGSVLTKIQNPCIKHGFCWVKHKALAPTIHRTVLKCCHITGRRQDYLSTHLYTLARVWLHKAGQSRCTYSRSLYLSLDLALS